MKLPEDVTLATATLDTPIGILRLAAIDAGLCGVLFPNQEVAVPDATGSARSRRHLDGSRRALERYFAGKLKQFSDVTLAPFGTAFQASVWMALRTIPFGETRTYGAIAASIGKPKAVRAVGLANGCNPLPIIVPCHRVVGADGTLTGFGGGLPTKSWLLAHEGIVLAPRRRR